MNVLSLFDGISCAKVALEKANIKVGRYYASEIDSNAIKISKSNHPEIIQIGDIKHINHIYDTIDLLIGGSPCQDLSIAKKDRKGLEGDRSGLFWEYIRLKNEVNPKYFILENVASMPQKDKDIITKELGVEPIMFNASLVSAQCRKRYFWTNIKFDLPEDKEILLKDILQPDAEVDERFVVNGKAFCLTSSYSKVSASPAQIEHNANKKQRTMVIGRDVGRRLNEEGHREDDNKQIPITRRIELRTDDKVGTITSVQKDNLVVSETRIRKLTPIECERLQGLPDDYTKDIAMTNRYKALGNAFNTDVVAHILSNLQDI